ncbi:malonyl-CoA decarboxylase [Sphingomonas sp. MMS24-J13]|uniref:malonyl-CoA decarboxylase n=1 Tax=Sphingomonas sp. MMS24-J13 TaxID=3238686 RepID=UPI00384F2BA6
MLAKWTSELSGCWAALTAAALARPEEPLDQSCERLLAPVSVGEKSRTAAEIHARFSAADDDEKRDFLAMLSNRYDADPRRLRAAIDAFRLDPDPRSLAELHAASEPRRQQILRRLNEIPNGTAMLLAMRSTLLRLGRDEPSLAALDADFVHLFASWFNGGFLELHHLDWSSSGEILGRLIHYEAVHPIESWDALRARLAPADRRCYAFFHPAMRSDPLIFVEVALTTSIPVSIADILRPDRPVIDPATANTAVFYSISNCQDGLRGIPFGGPLIKQVMELLRSELPMLRNAVTLSPMPGFAKWLREEARAHSADASLVERLGAPGWHAHAAAQTEIRPLLMRAAARYLTMVQGRAADPVARFHLGNGARIEQLDWLGDTSPKGLRQSFGMMVNYLYDPAHVEANCRAFAEDNRIAASSRLRRLARSDAASRSARRLLALMEKK